MSRQLTENLLMKCLPIGWNRLHKTHHLTKKAKPVKEEHRMFEQVLQSKAGRTFTSTLMREGAKLFSECSVWEAEEDNFERQSAVF